MSFPLRSVVMNGGCRYGGGLAGTRGGGKGLFVLRYKRLEKLKCCKKSHQRKRSRGRRAGAG